MQQTTSIYKYMSAIRRQFAVVEIKLKSNNKTRSQCKGRKQLWHEQIQTNEQQGDAENTKTRNWGGEEERRKVGKDTNLKYAKKRSEDTESKRRRR